ncbi:MAG TPA: VapC toxin family PIN domain ribonuclease [Lacunisphaera sp.]|jgi:predicted nucleic acid-binding protein|nr:VapC toxin family PIN domain ribonuclease [Lacunisphaera sp.]
MRHLLDNDVFFAALYRKHSLHPAARRWLDRAKPEGWGVASETYLAAIRLLMNPVVMKSGHLSARQAIDAVETELAGPHPGRIVLARGKPDPARLKLATGHKQVMDFWLVQIAEEIGCQLATHDSGLAAAWPKQVNRIN